MQIDTSFSIHLATQLHLILVAAWGGVVVTEAVLEALPRRRPELAPATAVFHYWIDLLIELPVLVCAIACGAAALVLSWPPSGWLLLKVACGLGAALANLLCIRQVLRRHRLLEQEAGSDLLLPASRTITATALAGVPLALVAAGIGLWLAHLRLTSLAGP